VGEFNKEARIQLSRQEVWQNIVAFSNFIINLVAGILILMWIYRANANARLPGAQDMKFTPGWSVGWFFIPFAMLFKPFQAMKEIWRASANPQDWQSQPVSVLVGWWWFFGYLITCSLIFLCE